MPVRTADLRLQHDPLRHELGQALQRVLDGSAFIGGAEVEAFEREFAACCEVPHAVGVANGTEALMVAMRALGIGPGDRVAVPTFTFAGTAEAVYHTGARPLFVDIDPQTFTLDPDDLRRRLQHTRVRAVVPVHLYGQAAAMEAIAAVADAARVPLIEDAAQAHGARYRDRRVGGLGLLAGFSFYPTKNLGALGDAGAVTTPDDDLARQLRLLRDHGQQEKYRHPVVGFNSRLDGLQAAFLRIKLRRLEAWNARRRALAAVYRAELTGVPGISTPFAAPDREHVYHLFVIRCRRRDALRAYLDERGIATGVHYGLPLHLQEAFADCGHRPGDFPVAEAAAREVLALPLYPELAEEAVHAVCEAVRAWARQAA